MIIDLYNEIGFLSDNIEKISYLNNYIVYDQQKVQRIILKVTEENIDDVMDFILSEIIHVSREKIEDESIRLSAQSLILAFFPSQLSILLTEKLDADERICLNIMEIYSMLEAGLFLW